ncbi:Gfo/Idh/MocA family protein [Candidatus Hydrogenedentota bacterium]
MTQQNRYTVALLGGGPRGIDHARAFLENTDRFELAGLCDRDEERLEGLCSLCPDARGHSDPDVMLEELKPDVFCFATPPAIRLELVELGVKHGVKAIAYEKPMAITLAEAKRINDLCNEAGVKTIVSHQHKYGKHWQKVKKIVESGDIGEVHTIHATSKGWLLHYATHLVDYMMFLNGGHRGLWVVGHAHGKNNIETHHPEPDYVMGHMEFDNGVHGIFECGDLAPDMPGENPFWLNAGITVYGSDGYAQVIIGSGWRAVTKSSSGTISGKGSYNVEYDQPLYIRDLADWLDDPAKVHPCNGEVSHHGFQLVMGACLSSLEQRKVTPPVETEDPIIARLAAQL